MKNIFRNTVCILLCLLMLCGGFLVSCNKNDEPTGDNGASNEEKVTVVGEKGSLKASILGPERSASQVEVSLTDARSIGVKAPIRESGDVAGSGACKLVGPCGEVELTEGVIAAKRHIHLTPAAAEEFGVADKQIVKVKTNGLRPLIFDDVVVRVNANFAPAMHIDTDEANAAFGVTEGEIIL